MKKAWYEQLFENYSKSYDKEIFTQGTKQEVDFIEKEIKFNKNCAVLDVGCGTGRHAIELAKRGYAVTGIDLSKDQLSAARLKAEKANVNVRFLHEDARNFRIDEKFDLAIMICEGGFPLMDTDEENFAILTHVVQTLQVGGRFIFTTLNALYPIFNNLKKFHDEHMQTGTFESHSFDIMTFRDRNKVNIPDDDGNTRLLDCNERYYTPSEITWLLTSLGMKSIEIWAGEIGNFQKRKLSVNDYEMLVIADK